MYRSTGRRSAGPIIMHRIIWIQSRDYRSVDRGIRPTGRAAALAARPNRRSSSARGRDFRFARRRARYSKVPAASRARYHDPVRDADQFDVRQTSGRGAGRGRRAQFNAGAADSAYSASAAASTSGSFFGLMRTRQPARAPSRRPDDAGVVVVLLDRRRDHARYPDAVSPWPGARCCLFVQHREIHRFAVLAAELEDVPDLDPRAIRSTPPSGARSPSMTLRVGDHVRLGHVAAPVHAAR